MAVFVSMTDCKQAHLYINAKIKCMYTKQKFSIFTTSLLNVPHTCGFEFSSVWGAHNIWLCSLMIVTVHFHKKQMSRRV